MGAANALNISQQGVTYFDGIHTFSGVDGSDAGKVLTSNGTGVAPSFQAAAPSGSSWVLIQTQAASNSSSIPFTSLGSYSYLVLQFLSVIPVTTGSNLLLQTSVDGGSNWSTSGYASGCNIGTRTSPSLQNFNTTSGLLLAPQLSTSSGNNMGSGWMRIYKTSALTYAVGDLVCVTTDFGFMAGVSMGTSSQNGINAIQVLMSSGNISSGSFSLYGILS